MIHRLSLMALAVTACTTVPPEDQLPEVGASGWRCEAGELGDLVGRPASVELGSEALRRSRSATLRWIRPGDIVTMDYRIDRLNVRLDGSNRVAGFACG